MDGEMNRELLVLRHAKSAWDTGAPSDFQRPLAKRGRKAAPRVGRWLLEQGLVPDHVVSSPAERARQTVLAVCSELGVETGGIHWDERVYGGWTRTLIDVLRDSPPDARRVLIAGHNPGLEDLVEALCAEQVPTPADGKLMPTAAVARLAIDVAWSELRPACGHLLSLTRARSLEGP
jgi:phosphohistidine phosphatase